MLLPSPLEQDVLDEAGALAYDDIDDEDPRLTAIKFCYKAIILPEECVFLLYIYIKC